MPDEPQRRRRVVIEGLTPARKPDDAGAPDQPPQAPAVPFAIGHGYDLHRVQDGGNLTLGGVVVSQELSAIAHSDGDVVFHALTDAILGALGMGDIGEIFPDTDQRWKDAASRVFVEEARDRARRAGFVISNVDVTLLLERPKIAPFKQQMILLMRQILGPQTIVNVKAGTNEGCDAIGRGEAVAAHAVVLLAARQ